MTYIYNESSPNTHLHNGWGGGGGVRLGRLFIPAKYRLRLIPGGRGGDDVCVVSSSRLWHTLQFPAGYEVNSKAELHTSLFYLPTKFVCPSVHIHTPTLSISLYAHLIWNSECLHFSVHYTRVLVYKWYINLPSCIVAQ